MFSTICFFVRKILKFVGSQIEIEKKKSLAGILTNFRKCCQSKNLKKLNFVNKNWPIDARVGCKSLSDLIEFIEMDEQLEEELQEFEGEFEKDEI
jgi:hypothetical protein